eukprot:Rmarinus@m.27019
MTSYLGMTGPASDVKRDRIALVSLVTLLMIGIIVIILASTGTFEEGSSDPEIYLFDKEDFSRYVAALVECYPVVGLSVSVVRGTELLYSGGFGLRDREAGLPATADTLFQIGSTSKAFTSLLVADQENSGNLDMDAPLSEYVDTTQTFRDDFGIEKGSLRDLLAHRTAVPRYDMLWVVFPQLFGYDRPAILSNMHHMYPAQDFRTGFYYNNWNYALAGEIAADAAGVGSWDEHVRSRIFSRLDMPTSTTHVRTALDTGNYAIPYGWDPDTGNQVRLPDDICENLDLVGPAGIIASSANEMANWLRMLVSGGSYLGEQVFSQDTLRRTTDPSTVALMPEKTPPTFPFSFSFPDYGLAWSVGTYRGYKSHTHNGGTIGHTSLVWYLDDAQLGVFVSHTGMFAEGDRLNQLVAMTAFDSLLGLPPSVPLEDACVYPCNYVNCNSPQASYPSSAPFASPPPGAITNEGSCTADQVFSRQSQGDSPDAQRRSGPDYQADVEIQHVLDQGGVTMPIDLGLCNFTAYNGTYHHPFLGDLSFFEDTSECKLKLQYYDLPGHVVDEGGLQIKTESHYRYYMPRLGAVEFYRLPTDEHARWVSIPEIEPHVPPVFECVAGCD